MVSPDGGTVGVTATEAAEAAEVPPLLLAVAVKVYGVPLVRPTTSHVTAGTVIVQPCELSSTV